LVGGNLNTAPEKNTEEFINDIQLLFIKQKYCSFEIGKLKLKMMRIKRLFTLTILLLIVSILNVNAQDKDPFAKKDKSVEPLTIVSGIASGSYHQIVNDIVKISTKSMQVRTSQGSVDNYQVLINDSKVDVVFMQSDVLAAAKQYDYKNKTDNSKNVKVLIPLANEEIHLVTRVNSGVYKLSDLAGKKVGVGVASVEGTHVTAGLIKSITGIHWEDVEINFDSAFVSLLTGDIDAFFFVGYAPAKKLYDLLPTYNQLIKLVPIEDDRLKRFHVKSVVKRGTYPWLHYDVNTYAVKSLLVTNTAFEAPSDKEDLKKLLLDIKENLEYLQQNGHPKWKEVDFNFKGVTWEVHDVAKEVFNLE
jgi:TRAP transporter TAXI family solute receptor